MNSKAPYIISKTISVLLHPLLLPTYGFALVWAFNLLNLTTPQAWVYYAVALGGTFTFTFLIPFSLILILSRQNRVSSIELRSQHERNTPYVYSFASFLVWCYFIRSIMHIESALFFICCAAALAIGIVALINLKWKISAHLTGMGCFIGGVLIITSMQGVLSNLLIVLLFLMALLLTYSRLYLKAHTGTQVSAGLLLGLSLTLLTLLFI